MDMAWWRDLVIVIWGLIGTIAMIFLCIIFLLFYRKATALMESADFAVGRLSDLVDYTKNEVISPVVQFGTLVQGIIQGVELFSNMFKKREGK